jgi:hypothetical protein
MNSAFDMTFIDYLKFPSYRGDGFVESGYAVMDDEHVVVFIWTGHGSCVSDGWWTVYFVSTKTFQVERSLSIARKYGFERYERGFLVFQSRDYVR